MFVTTDERTIARPQGTFLDIGAAVEVEGVELSSFVVTTTADRLDRFDFETSLREAILYANAMKGQGSHHLPQGPDRDDPACPEALLEVTDPLTVSGPGADVITVARSPARDVPAFRLFAALSGMDMTISGLTLTNGCVPQRGRRAVAADNSRAGAGGRHPARELGVDRRGDLRRRGLAQRSRLPTHRELGLDRRGDLRRRGVPDRGTLLQENLATGYGGAVFQDGGTLTVTGTTLDGNGADIAGGGLFLYETSLTLVDSTLRFQHGPASGRRDRDDEQHGDGPRQHLAQQPKPPRRRRLQRAGKALDNQLDVQPEPGRTVRWRAAQHSR